MEFRAGMTELADVADLKSAGPKGLWGFESPSRHQGQVKLRVRKSGICAAVGKAGRKVGQAGSLLVRSDNRRRHLGSSVPANSLFEPAAKRDPCFKAKGLLGPFHT